MDSVLTADELAILLDSLTIRRRVADFLALVSSPAPSLYLEYAGISRVELKLLAMIKELQEATRQEAAKRAQEAAPKRRRTSPTPPAQEAEPSQKQSLQEP